MQTLLQTLFLFLLVTQICFAQGSWAPIGDMPEIRLAHTADELNGKIYIVGGYNSEPVPLPTTALVYEISLGTWTQIALPNNEFKVFHTSCVVDGKLYAIGGWEENPNNFGRMERYDPLTETWDTTLAQPTPRGNLTCASIDGKIYAIGGMTYSGYTGLKTLEVYDVSTDTWTQLADMPTGRWGPRAIAFNGKIYVFGGTTGLATTVYASVEVYDPQNNTWTTKSGLMPTPRYQLTTCLLDGNIYAIGGWYNSGSGPIYDKVEVYNPDNDMWNSETPMPVARALLASILLDGKIRVFGGSSTTHPMTGTSGIYEFSNNDPLPSGTYTIGTGGYFTTIQNAFDKLSTDGVAGNVTLELIDDIYTAPTDSFGFKLNGAIPGTGPNSRVTIKPAVDKNVTIEGSGRAVVSFLNTRYVTIDGVNLNGPTTLRIHSLFDTQYSWSLGAVFYHPSANNIVQNITFEDENYTKIGATIAFMSFVNTTSTADSNLIENNFIKKAGAGIYISGWSANAKAKYNIVRGNIIGSATDSLITWGIQIERNQNTIIENNILENLKQQFNLSVITHGINIYLCTACEIRNNVLHNIRSGTLRGTTGILVSGDLGEFGSDNLIYNNMIYDIQSTSTQVDSRVSGILVWDQINPKVYYNSVYLSGTGANKRGSAALFVEHYNSVTNLDLKNNIFVNTRDESPYCASVIYDYTTTNRTSDYNDLFYDDTNANNCLVRIGSTNYNSLVDWQVTGFDLNSVTEMPNFVDPYLHIAENEETLLESRGIPITDINFDFDGQTRHATTPDIGADEFNGIPVDVEDEITLPTEFALEQNYPNPFNPNTTFRYSIPTQSKVVIKVYDILGSEIVTLMDEEKSVGTYELTWNAANLPSGVYFYQLRAVDPSTSSGQGFISTKKMLLLK